MDPRLHTWLYSLLIFLILGVGAFYILSEIETSAAIRPLFLLGYTFVFLVGVIVYQSFLIGYKAKDLAAHMTSGLSSSKELFLNLFRNSPIPYLLIDQSGKINLINIAAIRLFGVTQGALNGQNVFDLVTKEENEDDQVVFITSLFKAGKFINDEELEVKRPDGLKRWVMFSAFPFGKKHDGLITLVDFTKQKEIDIAKTEFVSLASHQMRTPISSMSWNIELLASDKSGPLNEKQQQLVVKINRGLAKINDVIKDFLDVSQLELGTFASQSSDIHLPTFFDDICDEFALSVTRKQIDFQKTYNDANITITTDKQLLHMIVSNLTSNAVKYTPDGGRVRVSYQADDAQVIIAVTDSGIGVPAEDQEKLFSKFFRASNARETVIKGTGLGLYIVKKAVEILGGEIDLNSIPNQSTTFTVTLPR